jgi:hypothetical protein
MENGGDIERRVPSSELMHDEHVVLDPSASSSRHPLVGTYSLSAGALKEEGPHHPPHNTDEHNDKMGIEAETQTHRGTEYKVVERATSFARCSRRHTAPNRPKR